MMQNVHPDEAGKHALEGFADGVHYRISITKTRNTNRVKRAQEKFPDFMPGAPTAHPKPTWGIVF
jgi:hypothetical protein